MVGLLLRVRRGCGRAMPWAKRNRFLYLWGQTEICRCWTALLIGCRHNTFAGELSSEDANPRCPDVTRRGYSGRWNVPARVVGTVSDAHVDFWSLARPRARVVGRNEGPTAMTRREALENIRYCRLYSLVLACADRKSTRLNSSHLGISYAVFC